MELLSAPVVAHASGGSSGPPWILWIVAPLFVVIGALLAVKPELQWKLNRWQYKNPDALAPSAKGLLATRVTGVAMVVIAVVVLVVALTR